MSKHFVELFAEICSFAFILLKLQVRVVSFYMYIAITGGLDTAGEILHHRPSVWRGVTQFRVPEQGPLCKYIAHFRTVNRIRHVIFHIGALDPVNEITDAVLSFCFHTRK